MANRQTGRRSERGEGEARLFIFAVLFAIGWWISANIYGCIKAETERREGKGQPQESTPQPIRTWQPPTTDQAIKIR